MTPERFMNRVAIQSSGCWHWTGSLTTDGYGRVYVPADGAKWFAHRLAYVLLVGPIPDGLTIDHMCHNADVSCAGGDTCLHRRCVNPEHLEPATILENALRGRGSPIFHRNAAKTHCKYGHEFTPENTYRRPGSTRRECRKCRSISEQFRPKRTWKAPKRTAS